MVTNPSRAWSNLDVQSTIVQGLKEPGDLNALAATSKLVHHLAERALWSTIPDVNVLFSGIFDHCHTPHSQFMLLDPERTVTMDQWPRLIQLAGYVRDIRNPVVIRMESAAPLERSMSSRPSTAAFHLFPQLRTLSLLCYVSNNLACSTALRFLSPSLRSLALNFRHGEHSHTCPCFASIQEGNLPHLSQFKTISAGSFTEDALANTFGGLPQIRALAIDAFDMPLTSLLAVVATFDQLHSIKLHPLAKHESMNSHGLLLPSNALPNLRHLAGDVGLIKDLVAGLESAATWVAVELVTNRTRIRNREVKDINAAVKDVAAGCTSLETFGFYMPPQSGRQLQAIPSRQNVLSFAPLARCTRIKAFNVHIAYEACDLTEAAVQHLVSSWPRLQKLDIGGMKARVPPTYTIDTINHILRSCPELQDLAFWVVYLSGEPNILPQAPKLENLELRRVLDSKLRAVPFVKLQDWEQEIKIALGYNGTGGILVCNEVSWVKDPSDIVH